MEVKVKDILRVKKFKGKIVHMCKNGTICTPYTIRKMIMVQVNNFKIRKLLLNSLKLSL